MCPGTSFPHCWPDWGVRDIEVNFKRPGAPPRRVRKLDPPEFATVSRQCALAGDNEQSDAESSGSFPVPADRGRHRSWSQSGTACRERSRKQVYESQGRRRSGLEGSPAPEPHCRHTALRWRGRKPRRPGGPARMRSKRPPRNPPGRSAPKRKRARGKAVRRRSYWHYCGGPEVQRLAN
jgi:hypothetical protein